MTSFKMMGAGPTVLARVRDAVEGRGQAEGNANLLRDFLSDLRTEVGFIKSDCFCGVTPVVGASLAKLADYSYQLDDFFDEVGRDPEKFMREREAKRQALLPKNRHLAAQTAKAGPAQIDAEAIYRARAERVQRAMAEPAAAPAIDTLSENFTQQVYASRQRQISGESDA
jgi:hypothetical protein